jgi:hypothetical protein
VTQSVPHAALEAAIAVVRQSSDTITTKTTLRAILAAARPHLVAPRRGSVIAADLGQKEGG